MKKVLIVGSGLGLSCSHVLPSVTPAVSIVEEKDNPFEPPPIPIKNYREGYVYHDSPIQKKSRKHNNRKTKKRKKAKNGRR